MAPRRWGSCNFMGQWVSGSWRTKTTTTLPVAGPNHVAMGFPVPGAAAASSMCWSARTCDKHVGTLYQHDMQALLDSGQDSSAPLLPC